MLIKLNMYKVFSSKMDELDLQELWEHAQSPLFSIDPLSIPQLHSKVDSLSGFYDFRPLCLELALGHPFTVPAPAQRTCSCGCLLYPCHLVSRRYAFLKMTYLL